ncbi:MAG: uroporphyrinogen-III synthase [Pseudomonadota bacterium]|nr:uroporphyrinogen-III synthase [Pseudomonadota bacterium]
MSAPCDLGGKGVLVTRPAGQAAGLRRLVHEAGGRAIPFAAIRILPVEDPKPAQRLLAQSWDLMIFISRNAVEQVLPLLPGRRLPDRPQLAAVGRATADALTDAGRAPDLVPFGRFDSESLLALPELADLAGRRVLVVRGEGGRAILGDTLAERGAELRYAEVYRRALPDVDPAPLLESWRRDVHLVTATSEEILGNLIRLVGPEGRELLLATPLVVVSERTAESARRRGFARVEVAERAADDALLSALCRAAFPGA